MIPRKRIEQQACYVLHARPWRETSLIVEVFSQDYGRMALVAKGARRPGSALRGVLQAFQPLLLDWSGGGEIKTLVRAERQAIRPLLGGQALLCAYYLNELLIALTPREDGFPAVFDAYVRAMAAMSSPAPLSAQLRRFELALLRELGYGVGLQFDAATGKAVAAGRNYVYVIEQGLLEAGEQDAYAATEVACISGKALLDMAQDRFDCAETLFQSKMLLRHLIKHYLGGRPLQSRRVFRELQEL